MKRLNIKEDIKVIDKDTMLNDLIISKVVRNNIAYQENKEEVSITKYVYKRDNAVFDKTSIQSPKLKCVFELHTQRTSSFVTVYDNENEVIFEGNYLWNNGKAKSHDDYIQILKRLHDFKSIKENFGL